MSRQMREMVRDAYDLGRENAKLEANVDTKWHNLTKAIADSEPIDWEKLDGVPAKSVHESGAEFLHRLSRKEGVGITSLPKMWVDDKSPFYWNDALEHGWRGIGNWTLYIDGEIPMKKKTADELPLAMCFSGKHESHSEPTTWIVLDNEMGKVCIAPFIDGAIDASKVEVIEEYGIGTLSKMVSNND